MNEKNMTALVSCFARAYHSKNYKYKIFDDYIAEKILTKEEYKNIGDNMKQGISFFNKDFKGTEEEALRFIVDNNLSPSVLGRSIYTEKSLENAIKFGTKQYLIFASGYDTFAYRNKNKNIKIFEIDKKEIIEDKQRRLKQSNINYDDIEYIETDFTNKDFINDILKSKYKKEISFCSLLGISYYLTKEEFKNFIKEISTILTKGSTIIFDYPIKEESEKEIINQQLAKKAKEEMKSKYSIYDIEKILEESNILIYENLTSDDMNKQYFCNYNILNPNNKIKAPKGINYCLVVKQ